jgi:Domain of unknown function (DUF4157)
MKSGPTTTMAPPITVKAPANTVMRKCDCGGTCDTCREAEKEKPAGVVQRRSASQAPAAASGQVAAPVASQIHAAARTGGNALPGATRTYMESQFGNQNFSGVRVHNDANAHSLSHRLGAEAFTVGNDIFFGANRYNPNSLSGMRTLAHELTHVVQQRDSVGGVQTKLELGSPDTAAEREAERVAASVVQGDSAGIISQVSSATIQRQPYPAPLETQVSESGGKRVILADTVPLEVLGLKAQDSDDHDRLTKLYDTAAKGKRLRTTHPGRSIGIWPVWARAREGMTNAAGQTPSEIDKQYHSQCSPDHVIELQVSGSDDPNNLRILSQDRNEKAGSQMAGQLRKLLNFYLAGDESGKSYLEFTAVKATGSPSPDACLTMDPLLFPQGAVKTGKGARGKAYSDRLEFQVGGVPAAIGYGKEGEKGGIYSINPDHRFAVPGLHLKQVKVPPSGSTLITANISEKISNLPLKGGKFPDFDLEVSGTPAQIKMAATAPGEVKLAFPFLSDAILIPRFENGQWVAVGDFTPTLPLLRFVQVHLEIRNNSFQGGVKIPPEKLRQALPVPGLTLDPVNLVLGIADGVFSATGGFGFKYGALATGQVGARFEAASGFHADGEIHLHIPGLDEAKGTARIEHGKFGAHLTAGKKEFKFPGVKSAGVDLDVADGLLAGSGHVVLGLPGGYDVPLSFLANSKGEYSISGVASFKIPGLRDPRLEIAYSNAGFSGQAHAGFLIPGLEGGGLDLRYANNQLSGIAVLDYKRGKLTGHVQANLSPALKLSGAGQLGYEIAPGLVAIVGLEIRENGTAKVSGELRLPDPIIIFPEKGIEKKLFGISIDIPIFGISVGASSVGVIANLAAALNARAGIGPGQIRHPKILASFDPANEAGAASFQASAELFVPAYAEIALVLSGGIGVSLLIVKAIGGIQATGAAGLTGALLVPIELRYLSGKFALDGAAELYAQPHLRFQLDAFVKVIVDLLLTTIEVYNKTWKLAAFEWGSDFKIGLRFPVHYVFGEPFNLSLDQVQFIAPQIDAKKIIKDLLPK